MGAFIPPGAAIGGTPGGSSGQLQFNDAGAFAGVPNSSVDPSTGNTTFSARWINARNSTTDAPANTMTGTWFTGGTSTTTKPHFLIEPAGTTSTAWSTAGTGFGVNASSGFTGNLLDLQVGGVSQVWVGPVGTSSTEPVFRIRTSGIWSPSGGVLAFGGTTGGPGLHVEGALGAALTSSGSFWWTSAGSSGAFSLRDLVLVRDAAGTLAQRNGTNAQAFRVYNTFTSTTSFERLNIRWTANEAIIDTEAGSGGGTLRGLKIGSAATSLLGFYGATPIARGAAVADATDAATAITQLNALLARVRAVGLITT